jgi:hypothetical protein
MDRAGATGDLAEDEFLDVIGRKAVGIEVGGLLGLIVLVADIWAIVNVFQSAAGTGTKVIWIVVILLLPLLGLIIWLLAGPRSGRA